VLGKGFVTKSPKAIWTKPFIPVSAYAWDWNK